MELFLEVAMDASEGRHRDVLAAEPEQVDYSQQDMFWYVSEGLEPTHELAYHPFLEFVELVSRCSAGRHTFSLQVSQSSLHVGSEVGAFHAVTVEAFLICTQDLEDKSCTSLIIFLHSVDFPEDNVSTVASLLLVVFWVQCKLMHLIDKDIGVVDALVLPDCDHR